MDTRKKLWRAAGCAALHNFLNVKFFGSASRRSPLCPALPYHICTNSSVFFRESIRASRPGALFLPRSPRKNLAADTSMGTKRWLPCGRSHFPSCFLLPNPSKPFFSQGPRSTGSSLFLRGPPIFLRLVSFPVVCYTYWEKEANRI